MTEASALFAGLCVVAVAIAFGLDKIATAIRCKRTDVNLTSPIRFIVTNGTSPSLQPGERQG